ncbi:MAG: ion channel [Ferruginibacter sp.]
MGFSKKIRPDAVTTANTGFGNNASNYGGRLVNKDGTPNIEKTGLGPFERISWFHSMLSIPRWRFFVIVLFFYVGVNLLFTLIYYFIGVEKLSGLNVVSEREKFTEAFFFSTQTFTTVGYGRISPTGFAMNAVSSFQALIGLLSFAVATGLMYGRFSRPKSFLRFGSNAIIAPYKDMTGLMIRVAPYKNTTLSDAEAILTMVIISEDHGKLSNKFYTLPLELRTISSFTLSWTLVHPIDESSPLYGFTKEDFANIKGEIMIYIKAFDDMFSNTVISRTSYTMDEVAYGVKFTPMFYRDDIKHTTMLDMNKLSAFEDAPMPAGSVTEN